MDGWKLVHRVGLAILYLARIQQGLSSAREQTAAAALRELDIPRARNLMDTQAGWWKKYISPYLYDATSVMRNFR